MQVDEEKVPGLGLLFWNSNVIATLIVRLTQEKRIHAIWPLLMKSAEMPCYQCGTSVARRERAGRRFMGHGNVRTATGGTATKRDYPATNPAGGVRVRKWPFTPSGHSLNGTLPCSLAT